MNEPPLRRIHKALAARYPLVYVRNQDEQRLENLLREVAASHYGDDRPLVVWTSTRGFTARGELIDGSCDPLDALKYILASAHEGFFLLKDLPELLAGRPALIRALRDLYQALAGRDSCVFLSSAGLSLPDALVHEVLLVDLGIPTEHEIIAELRRLAEVHARLQALDASWFERVAAALRGLMLNQVVHLVRRLVAEDRLDLDAVLMEIHQEKADALMREACLELVAQIGDLDRIGGLENLKEWVESRKALFSGHASESVLPVPSGILFMGVSGCGKSLAAKVIAGAWNLPLVRLDMNLVLSGAFGSPEYAFDHALRVAEQIAPLVLWIDEMENSFGYDTGSRGATNQNIFSSFLTWMQEKPAGVFVVATANRIERLPAEVIRKGRFDQLFFLDLPDTEERRAILEIHIGAAGGDPTRFNLATLAAITKNWSGAEIEQAIRSAVVHARQEQRAFNERDMVWSAMQIVPLSRTMEEQIKQLRQWSQDRATPASRRSAN